MFGVEWPHHVALGATKIGSSNARENPLGAFLGAFNFNVEILSFKIKLLQALFDAPKHHHFHKANPNVGLKGRSHWVTAGSSFGRFGQRKRADLLYAH
jgi:hypothetical protein